MQRAEALRAEEEVPAPRSRVPARDPYDDLPREGPVRGLRRRADPEDDRLPARPPVDTFEDRYAAGDVRGDPRARMRPVDTYDDRHVEPVVARSAPVDAFDERRYRAALAAAEEEAEEARRAHALRRG
eukprot:TRINITY_DN8123_c0_g1_i1.p4 TRINITY_DN8123_c0_g1~~TRINITY_DN8123_c0_g1_i1.p4  ORF type:complete len:128 (+),score=27.41 TRINITY_DN8123_c0_g1_i1:398-781(+)